MVEQDSSRRETAQRIQSDETSRLHTLFPAGHPKCVRSHHGCDGVRAGIIASSPAACGDKAVARTPLSCKSDFRYALRLRCALRQIGRLRAAFPAHSAFRSPAEEDHMQI